MINEAKVLLNIKQGTRNDEHGIGCNEPSTMLNESSSVN